ncbi:hypothetical protein K0M31_010766, partial [Melipona bicolor]
WSKDILESTASQILKQPRQTIHRCWVKITGEGALTVFSTRFRWWCLSYEEDSLSSNSFGPLETPRHALTRITGRQFRGARHFPSA